jgi:hypothetical protein
LGVGLTTPHHKRTAVTEPQERRPMPDMGCRAIGWIHLPSPKVYHRFDYQLDIQLEQSFIETISIRLVAKSGDNVKFASSAVPCITILHFKRRFIVRRIQSACSHGSLYTVLLEQSGGGGIGPVYRASFRVQRGHGIGSFFKGLFRFVKPLLFSGAKTVGKEALKMGANILSDIVQRIPDQ